MDVTAIAIVAIVGGIGYSAYEKWMDSKVKQPSVDSDQVKQELAALRERVSVLESIVTDRDFNLKREFDRMA